ncbi:unnamed protein product [Rotaria sp. Silwood2]|nr:unnamed protein product [Rotaria sp. Silwood2]CAF3394164.1 unnamed protein product [Rotaria sp. Silwood2]CAF3491881.1 unnamed protein product [Rotaria sp. Silwood2]CAF4259277.1 unnamed protein product [Rotaria sp. Silwood2]CAF4576641.1 unnamed protein product [Rotaria sp. Silwood2]
MSANDSHVGAHGKVESMDYENVIAITRSEEKVDASTQTEKIDSRNVSINCTLMTKNIFSVPITIPPYSNKYCIICNANFSTQRTVTLTDNERMNTFKFYLIYLRGESRCCRNHLENNCLKSSAIETLKRNNPQTSSVTYELFSTMIKEIQIELKRTSQSLPIFQPPLNFDDPLKYTDEDYKILIGIEKNQFFDLCTQVTMRNTNNRSVEMAIGCLLTKLRLGVSNKVLKILFSFSSDRLVAHINHSAYVALLQSFVPQHLGFQHISRNNIIKNHTRSLAKNLLADGKDVAILILDGTYIYCQKSANNVLQRRLFSLHKNRPLLKPMIICATDGYIISAVGPYLSDWYNNDASITKHILLSNKEEIHDWLVEKDIMIVDRGFRDCLDLVNSFGYTTFMPLFLPKSKKFSTSEANSNRFVTVLRWVVESVNGRIKTFKFFDHVVQNSSLPYVHGYLSIVCAIINAYRPTFITDTSNDDNLSKAFLEKRNKQNELETILNDKERNTAHNWKKIDGHDSITDFPKLTEADLTNFTLGVFQLKQARSYSLEHIAEDGQYEIHVCKQQLNLLRAKIQSKHSNRKDYQVLIQYNDQTVTAACCGCPNGNQNIGCCSHIASIVWYLGIARHDKLKYLNQRSLSYMNLFEDAADVSDVSSDEEDDDETLYSLV